MFRYWLLLCLTLSAADRQDEIEAHARQARQDLASGHPDRAEAEFAAIIKLDTKNVDARGNIGVLRYLRGDCAGAEEYLKPAAAAEPPLWKARVILGICESRLERAAAGRQLLIASLPHLGEGPLRKQAALELLQMDYRAGDLDKAVDTIRLLQRGGSEDPDVLYTEWRIYSDLADRARDALGMAAPNSGRMHQLMAQYLIHQGRRAEAIAQYRKALDVDPGLRGIHYELGEAILGSGDLADAEREFRAAAAEDPRNANVEYQLGEISGKRQEPAAAEAHYRKALALQPDHVPSLVALATLLVQSEKTAEALPLLSEAVRLDPLNATAHFQLAKIYRGLHREDDARRETAVFQKLQEATQKLREALAQMHQ